MKHSAHQSILAPPAHGVKPFASLHSRFTEEPGNPGWPPLDEMLPCVGLNDKLSPPSLVRVDPHEPLGGLRVGGSTKEEQKHIVRWNKGTMHINDKNSVK